MATEPETPSTRAQTAHSPAIGEKLSIRTGEFADLLGASTRTARRILTRLEAAGLRRKGRGLYDRRQVLRAWEAYDERS
jgi:DNA-binding MarR family transcriptional regulator